MTVVLVLTALLCWQTSLCVEDLRLTLRGNNIPDDGSGRILITNINPTGSNSDTLTCHYGIFEDGDWYIWNDKIDETFSRGWSTHTLRSPTTGQTQLGLRRVSATAEEGVFTCRISNDSISVGIFYPINSVLATLVVVSRRKKTFRVQCTSAGGRALSMTVTGPDGFNSDLNNIQAVGDPQRTGDDEFSACTDVILGGRDGDIYQCIVSNGVSSDFTNSVELRVASAPTITSLEQISATALRVGWSQPPEGATVTAYVVHYSTGDTDRTESVTASSTSSDITHLTSGLTYTISVEATSQHLSGEAEEWTITVKPVPEGVIVSDVKPTSVRVSWQVVDDADRYTVTLTQTMGDDQLGLCPEASHTVSINTSSLNVVVGQTDDDMLRAYTLYSITLVAESDVWGSSQHSDPVTFTTKQSRAAVSPRNVAARIVSSTVISLQWDGLTPCSQVNGLIVEYTVQYTVVSSGLVQSINVAGEWNMMSAQTSLTGLTPYTNYSIQIAAVNEHGDVGLYSDSIIISTQEGLRLTLKGNAIPTDGSGRIVIADINPTPGESNSDTLTCHYEISEDGYWYLWNDKIDETYSRGWSTHTLRSLTTGETQLRLRRVSATAEEGVFTCRISDASASVGVFYPINSVLATLVVVARKTFRVRCISTGGRALSMTVTGPDGLNSDLNNIQAMGDPQRIGDDDFSASTDVILGGKDGDIYQCIVSNGVSSDSTNSVELRVASAPTITSLEQISATTLRVEWSQPSEGAIVTGYVVHYSDGDTDRTESVAAPSTSSDITHLTSGLTYTISVEVTSQHLSGESDEMAITLELPLHAPHGVMADGVGSASVRASWQAVEDAERYTITFTKAMGKVQEGLCLSDLHTASVAVNTTTASIDVGKDVEQAQTAMLRAFTTYLITVIAESNILGTSNNSDPVTFTTQQTRAAVAPSKTWAKAEDITSTSIRVRWAGLRSCRLVNGLIVKYRTQYSVQPNGTVQSKDKMVNSTNGRWNLGGTTLLTGLTPFTNYSIQIAAVNEKEQVGKYSDFETIQTKEAIPGPVQLVTSFASFFNITITWEEPAVPNGVIIAYEVSYRPLNTSQPVTRLNTTELATSFTTPSDLEVETEFIFSVRAYTREGPGNATFITTSTLYIAGIEQLPSSEMNCSKSKTSIVIGAVVAVSGVVIGVIVGICGIFTVYIRIKSQSRSGKTSVDIKDNPAYGVNYQKTSTITEPPSAASREAVYELVRL